MFVYFATLEALSCGFCAISHSIDKLSKEVPLAVDNLEEYAVISFILLSTSSTVPGFAIRLVLGVSALPTTIFSQIDVVSFLWHRFHLLV